MAEIFATELAQETPAATPDPVVSPTDATAAPEGETKQVEQKTFTQAELDEIVQAAKAKAEARAERQSLKRERDMLERFTPQQQAPQAETRPPRDKFANDEEWVEAVTDWKLDQRDRKANELRAEDELRANSNKTEKIYAQAEKLPGFDRQTFEDLPLTPVIAQTIVDSDIPAQLMAYMASNPDDVERIAKLSSARQAAEIGRLEAKLSLVKATKEVPAPPKTVGSGGPVHNGALDRMDMAEYIATRRKMGARY